MDEMTFWRLIEASREAAEGDIERRPEELQALLAKLPPDDIVRFDGIYRTLVARAYAWDLWGAAYVINGGCSDDGFDYFRDWLISKGRSAYATALRSADSLADLVDEDDLDVGCELEGLRYAPAAAWAESTGRDEDDFPDSAPEPQAAEPAGEPWSEDPDELARRFPKLCAKFQ
jgi:hypothetical protein